MTVIVSILWQDTFVAQITDRKLTIQTCKTFDELSNKTLVYWARDAIVCLAYTGPAYIEDRPTDCWIARQLWGKDLDNFGTDNGGTIIRSHPLQYHIGEAIKILEAELKASEIGRQKNFFELHIVGWRWKLGKKPGQGKKRPQQVRWMIGQQQGGEIAVHHAARRFLPGFQREVQYIASPSQNLPDDQLRDIAGRIRDIAIANPELPMIEQSRQIEDEVVRSIRDIALVNPYVGFNCMSVLIAPPHVMPLVRIRFFTDELLLARRLGAENAPEDYEGSFSPWIIEPSWAMAPQVVLGEGWAIALGPFRVELSGKPTQRVFDGTRHIAVTGFSNHIRPKRPR